MAEQCAAVTASMQAYKSADEHSVESKQSETRALKSMFVKYGAVRGILLSKMSERERRDVFLKGAHDLARAKLPSARDGARGAGGIVETRRE